MITHLSFWQQDILFLQIYGFGIIVALCLVSVWTGSLLIRMQSRSERFFMGLSTVAMIAWLLTSVITMIGFELNTLNIFILIRISMFHLLFSSWFLMSIQMNVTSERFRTIAAFLLLFDFAILVVLTISSRYGFFNSFIDNRLFSDVVTQFIVLINTGKLFAGSINILNMTRMRKRSRQIYSFLIPIVMTALMIARMQWEHIHIRQLFDALFLFSFLFLWETSFRTAPMVTNTLSALIFKSMDRVAFILGDSGKLSYLSSGAKKNLHVLEELQEEQIKKASGNRWQLIGEEYRWRSYDLHGGYLVFIEDIKDRTNVLRQRDRQLEELHMKKNLLLQRGSLNRELEQFQTRLRILSSIEESISKWLRELESRIAELDEENITRSQVEEIKLLCAYIRRRSNLAVAEFQNTELDPSVIAQWCEEILQMSNHHSHLEFSFGGAMEYSLALSTLHFFLRLSKETSGLDLWVYGVMQKDGKLSLTLSCDQATELIERLECFTSYDRSIKEDEGEVSLVVRLEGYHG